MWKCDECDECDECGNVEMWKCGNEMNSSGAVISNEVTERSEATK